MESAVVEHGVRSVHFLEFRGLSVEAEQSKEPKHGSEKEPMSHIRCSKCRPSRPPSLSAAAAGNCPLSPKMGSSLALNACKFDI